LKIPPVNVYSFKKNVIAAEWLPAVAPYCLQVLRRDTGRHPAQNQKKYLSIGDNRSASFFLWQGGWAAFFMMPDQT
jgi:hypothetical protein